MCLRNLISDFGREPKIRAFQTNVLRKIFEPKYEVSEQLQLVSYCDKMEDPVTVWSEVRMNKTRNAHYVLLG